MALPNFLIIGAAKAGTTSLYRYLCEHPQVFMSPVKEPRYFAMCGKALTLGDDPVAQRVWSGTVTTLDEYQALFSGVSDEVAIGEASPLYLWSPEAPEAIQDQIPEVKLIACLRNPVERAFSHFLHNHKVGLETHPQFEDALQDDAQRHYTEYVEQGCYHKLLKRYYDRFAREQIAVWLYEDLVEDPAAVMRGIYDFLGVDNTFLPDTTRKFNVSQQEIPRSRRMESLLEEENALKTAARWLVPPPLRRAIAGRLRRSNTVEPVLGEQSRSLLMTAFRNEILSLQDLIERDLSTWLA